jgi:hypothetical protein
MRATGKRSFVRAVAGGVSLAGSLIVIPAGFIMMVRALERSGHGSTAVAQALAVLAGGGGLLGLGIALIIWELSVRYNVRH